MNRIAYRIKKSRGDFLMKPYSKLTKEELHNLKEQLEKQYEEVKKKGLNLDMSRGKPSDRRAHV